MTSPSLPLLPARQLWQQGQPAAALALLQDWLDSGAYDTDALILAGLCAAQLLDTEQARLHWERVLDQQPGNAVVHFNLGVMYRSLGDAVQAEAHYRMTLLADPGNALALLNLGILLAEHQQPGVAESCFLQLLEQDEHHAPALTNLAALYAAAGRDEDAEQMHLRAAAAADRDPDIHTNFGVFLADRARYDAAERHHRRALVLAPDHAAAMCNLAVMLTWQERYLEAESLLRRALELEPWRADLYTNLGILYDETGRHDEAVTQHRQALARAPLSGEVLSNLGNALGNAERYQEACACYARALEIDATDGRAWGNLAAMLAQQGDAAGAEAAFRHALQLDPHHARVRLNLSYLLLGQGRYAEGWVQHESRSDPRMRDRPTLLPLLPFPQWRGEALAGKSLLIWAEQGFGDEIQFCRFVPALKRMGARSITLVTKTPLKRLLQSLPGVDEILTQGDGLHRLVPHDFWTLPLSLPLWSQIPENEFARDVPYLAASAEVLAQWAERVDAAIGPGPRKPRVGLVWKGNAGNRNDIDRSLPGLHTLQPLFDAMGDRVHWISVQKGSGEEEAVAAAARGDLFNLGSQISDFADTAALLAQLDVLISVDTAAAHVAGAMDKECWVLLPKHKTDWRWLEKRDDSPWYPNMQLLRQPLRRDWDAVIKRLALMLQQRFS